jgi:hypothetical protein
MFANTKNYALCEIIHESRERDESETHSIIIYVHLFSNSRKSQLFLCVSKVKDLCYFVIQNAI